MKVLCILDIALYKTYLKKYFLSREIEFVFVSPERSQVQSRIASLVPDVVLMQDSYCEVEAPALYAAIRESLDALGGRTRIMLLCPAADLPPGVRGSLAGHGHGAGQPGEHRERL